MKLDQKLIDALTACGATAIEMASITAYYADQLVAANATVDQIKANIESLQKQLEEETARAERIRDAIGKFVVSEEAPPTNSTGPA
jgi:hypothetical protein